MLCEKGITLRMVRPAGLEPATTGLEGRCSIQMSYGRDNISARSASARLLLPSGERMGMRATPGIFAVNGVVNGRGRGIRTRYTKTRRELWGKNGK